MYFPHTNGDKDIQSQIWTNHTVTDLLKALLGNGLVNSFQHTCNPTVEEVFSVRSALRNSRRAVFSVWSAPRSSRIAVFSAWSVPRLYNGNLFVALMGTESRSKGMGIQRSRDWIGEQGRVLESRSPRSLKKKWQDFIVIWSDSSCVEIRYRDMTSGDLES
jgi:hypothetical protein